jgi:hypothetical protein
MRHPDSDAEFPARPTICEHADPCPSPMLSTQMARGAGQGRCTPTDGVISQRQRRTIVTASVEASNGCRGLEMPEEQDNEVKHSC